MGRGAAAGPRPLRVGSVADLPRMLEQGGIPVDRPVVVLVGGAAGMADDEVDRLADVLREAVLPALGPDGVVVDGGTDAGVMRAAGRARGAAGASALLVGVAAEGTVAPPAGSSTDHDAPQLEPHHTHVLLVPGSRWGDESSWLDDVADAVAARGPSVTVLVNGGAIAADDVRRSVTAGRPVVVLGGTGRLADEVAAAPDDTHHPGAPGDAGVIARSGLTTLVDVDDRRAVAAAVAAALR